MARPSADTVLTPHYPLFQCYLVVITTTPVRPTAWSPYQDTPRASSPAPRSSAAALLPVGTALGSSLPTLASVSTSHWSTSAHRPPLGNPAMGTDRSVGNTPWYENDRRPVIRPSVVVTKGNGIFICQRPIVWRSTLWMQEETNHYRIFFSNFHVSGINVAFFLSMYRLEVLLNLHVSPFEN